MVYCKLYHHVPLLISTYIILSLQLLFAQTPRPAEIFLNTIYHTAAINCLCFNHDGSLLAVESYDKTIKIIDVKSRTVIYTLVDCEDNVSTIAFSPDGAVLAMGGKGNTIKLWNVERRALNATLNRHTDYIHMIAFNHDGTLLASSGRDNMINIWNVKTKQVTNIIQNRNDFVSSIAFNHDGSVLAASMDNTITLWNMKTFKQDAVLGSHNDFIYKIAFSSDGSLLASASADKTVKLWDVKTKKLLALFVRNKDFVNNRSAEFIEMQAKFLTSHPIYLHDFVYTVAFSPDGVLLASGGGDNMVKLWDVRSKKQVSILRGHEKFVYTIAFSPDGSLLASGSGNGVVRIWNTKTLQLLSITAFLPNNEWLTYHPNKHGYVSSSHGDEYAAIRFNTGSRRIYPLKEFREKLKISQKIPLLFDSLPILNVQESFLFKFRYFWENFNNKYVWVGVSLNVMLLSLITCFIFLSFKNHPLVRARTFFKSGGCSSVKTISSGAFWAEWDHPKQIALVLLWEHQKAQNIHTIQAILEKYRKKAQVISTLYVILKKQYNKHSVNEIIRMCNEYRCKVLPLDTHTLRYAVEQKECRETLNTVKKRHLIQTDPYMEHSVIKDPVMFFGRKNILDRLQAMLIQGTNIGIFGSRKIGKTSLLYQIEQLLIDIPVVQMSCHGAGSYKKEDYFGNIITILKRKLKQKSLDSVGSHSNAPCNDFNFKEQYLDLFSRWEKRGRHEPFILIFDEIEDLFPERTREGSGETLQMYVKFFGILRELMQYKKCCTIVVSGYRPTINRYNILSETLGSNPMFASFQEVFLGFFNIDESGEMIKNIGAWKSIEWEEEAIAMIYTYCGGHPLITREFASLVCHEGAKKHIVPEDVKKSADIVVNTFNYNSIGNFFEEELWNRMRSDEQELILTICQKDTSGFKRYTIEESLQEAYANLTQFGLLSNSDNEIAVTGSLFNAWLRRMLPG